MAEARSSARSASPAPTAQSSAYSHIRVLPVELEKPTVGALGVESLDELGHVGGMRPGEDGPQPPGWARLAKLACGVLVDHREHRVAHVDRPAVTAAQKACVQERLERVEIRVAHRLGRGKGETAREDREPGEELPLVRLQKLIAPVERGAQRPLPRRSVARPSG